MCYGKSFILRDWMHEWTGDLLLSFKVAVWIICLPRLLNLKTYYRQQVRVLLSRVTATSGLTWFKEEEASSSLGGEDSSSPLEHTVQVTIQVPPKEGAGSGGDPCSTFHVQEEEKKQKASSEGSVCSPVPHSHTSTAFLPLRSNTDQKPCIFPFNSSLLLLQQVFSKWPTTVDSKEIPAYQEKKILRQNGHL